MKDITPLANTCYLCYNISMKKRKYTKVCKQCKKEYHPFNHKQLFCSNKCRGNYDSFVSKTEKVCKQCNKIYKVRKGRNLFYCSRKCYITMKSKTTKVINCLICGKELEVKKSEIKRNKKFCSRKCMGEYYSESKKGENNPSYKDGLHTKRLKERDALRSTKKYKDFLRAVFIRDKNICQICGIKRKRVKDGKGKNSNITVHHIKHWKNFPELRYEVSNGIVLCKECHKDQHRKRK